MIPPAAALTLDVRYYSPFCLAIGTGFATLAIKELLP
jgi:hypothetical protein